MKSYIQLLLTFLCLHTFLPGSAQSFLEPGNTWTFEHNSFNSGGYGDFSQTIETITVGNDTLINGLNYFKLDISLESICGIFTDEEYLRAEAGKVYRLRQDHSDELLIMDFNAQSPYTITYEASWGNEIIETTAIIDSTGIETLPDGTELEVQYLRLLNNSSYEDDATYILSEEVGFLQYGFLFPDIGTGLCDVDYSQILRCFIGQTYTYHFVELLDCYDIFIIDNTIEPSLQNISLSPNPLNDYLEIPFGYQVINVFDLWGTALSVPNQNTNRIDFSDKPSGIYIILLQNSSDSKFYTSKVIKN